MVISIVAVLIALLLPSLAQARGSARGVSCLSNMRQVAAGWQMYADIHRDVSVPGQPGRYDDDRLNLYDVGNGLHYRPRWFAILGAAAGIYAYQRPSEDPADEHRYPVNGSDVYLCPEADDWLSTRNFGYGYNHQFLGNARFIEIDSGASDLINYPVRASGLWSSATVLAVDGVGTAAGKPARSREPNIATGARDDRDATPLFARGGHGYIVDPPRLAEAGSDYADPRYRADEHRSGPDARHHARANASFADGHVESLTANALGYAQRPDGSLAARGPQTTNRLFSGTLRDDLAPGLDGR